MHRRITFYGNEIESGHLGIANCQYMVRESVRNGRFGEPKTGERLIDLPDFLVKELADYVRKLRKQALMGGHDVQVHL